MKIKALKNMTYATRRLVAGDTIDVPRRYGRILVAVKKAVEVKDREKSTLPAPPARIMQKLSSNTPSLDDEQDERPALRAQYKEVYGKAPFMGWDADILREKIAEKTIVC